MGLSLKGKEPGRGISQRKDGRFSARYTTSSGFRKQKYFKSLSECRQWLAEELFKKEYCNVENYAESTMNHTRGLLHQLFDTAVDLDIIDKNPVKRQLHDVKGRATDIYVTVFDSDEMREMNFIQDKLIV